MSQIDDLINFLKGELGKPYQLGAIGPDGYDCSGLTYTAFQQSCNILLPRVSTDQYSIGVSVDLADIQKGDLLFFDTGSSSRKPNHVGVCIGDQKMINANSYANKVVEESYMSSYWQGAYYGTKRALNLSTPFMDVPISSPFYEYIIDLYEKGVVSGYPDGTFKPEQGINRAEVLKIILEAFEIPLVEIGDSPFSDVNTSDWFFKYVKTAYEQGIVNGYPDGTFKPANNVNRVECLKIALNTAGVTLPSSGSLNFSDVQATDWFYAYVLYATNESLIDPVSDTLFGAANDMKRGEMCKVVSLILP